VDGPPIAIQDPTHAADSDFTQVNGREGPAPSLATPAQYDSHCWPNPTHEAVRSRWYRGGTPIRAPRLAECLALIPPQPLFLGSTRASLVSEALPRRTTTTSNAPSTQWQLPSRGRPTPEAVRAAQGRRQSW
jgi:hypothetical protein